MTEPVEHKLQNVIMALRRMWSSSVMYVMDRPKLKSAIEALEESDTKIAQLSALRDELYRKILDRDDIIMKMRAKVDDQAELIKDLREIEARYDALG